MSKECCTPQECDSQVKVSVDVGRIVKYLSVAAVLIVGIIFGTKTFRAMLEADYFKM